jgi:hypothetical protein
MIIGSMASIELILMILKDKRSGFFIYSLMQLNIGTRFKTA